MVDVATADGIAAAGFPQTYPIAVDKSDTRAKATVWHRSGHEGVVCRSNSVASTTGSTWEGSHEPWSELAIFTKNTRHAPALLRAHHELDWLF